MLTLQNILDSDSLSTLVAKLNANFSSIALSNGGPQGVRGEQGIPGLPGKQGATGPAGPVGATGPAPGIIPFSTAGTTVTYTPTGAGYPQPSYNDLSYDFLVTGPNAWGPLGPAGSGFAIDGQLYFDNNNLGWWKYLAVPDPTPTTDTIGGSPAQTYVESPFYDSASGGNWTGPDWYFYPLNLSSITALTQGVWTADKTNYLGTLAGSLYGGPATGPTLPSQTPYEIANARMNSKFGTVWISSFDGQSQGGNPALPTGSDGDDSNDTPYIYYWDYVNGPRLSSGIDRSLFKMSVDGPQYFDMMKARAWTDTDGGPGVPIIGVPYIANGGTDIPNDSTLTIQAINAGNHPTYFARPIYNITIDGYAPIQFFTGRNTVLPEDEPETNTTLGYLQFTTSPAGSVVPDAKIHLFTTRQNDEFYNSSGDITTVTSSTNTGEAVWDVRRFITSNQYLNMFPQDTDGFTSVSTASEISAPYAPVYGGLTQRDSWDATNKWNVFQGYHSVFTGQKVIQNASGGNQNSISSIDTWIYEDRQSWYGTSIFANKPDLLTTQTQQELVRSAGMMIDAKNWGWDSNDWNVYMDRVYFYTSNMVSFDGDSPNDYDNPNSANNAMLSLPVAHFSGTRNVGIGTFTNDKAGMFEPTARMQVHSDWRNKDFEGFGYNTNYTDSLGSFAYTNINKPWLSYTDVIPRRSMKTAAFTIERNSPALIWGSGQGGVFDGTKYEVSAGDFDDWYSRGVFNDIMMGAVAPPAREYENFAAGLESAMGTYLRPTSGIRYESFNYTGKNSIVNANPARNYGWGFRGALRLGTSPYFSGSNKTTPTTDEIGSNANLQNLEYQFNISPLSFSSSNDNGAKTEMISGIGIQNLYPRTRTHFYGKNTYQEFRFDEAYSPGSENSATSNAEDVDVENWGSRASNNQITIDYVGNSYWYNAGIYDYAYDFTVTPTGVVYTTQYSPNARNYPTREIGVFKRTKSTYHPTNNYALLTNTPSTINSYGSLHGGTDTGLWAVDKYIGFNAFRDLLGKGDAAGELTSTVLNTNGLSYDKYASNWRIGTEGLDGTKDNRDPKNGGSLILTDSEGKMGFSFIPAFRDGGPRYGLWEQQNVGTREIVDNIKIVFDDKGNIGIGNAPGLDENAYPSQYLNSATGTINYLPNANGAVSNPTAVGPGTYVSLGLGSAWIPTIGDTYGFGVPIGSAQSGFDAAGINAKVTEGEKIRFEISGEKASTRVGHTPQRRGYGYPGWSSAATTGLPVVGGGVSSLTTISITDNATADYALRYVGISNNALEVGKWQNAVHLFTFDNLGRMMSYLIEFASASPFVDGADLYANYALFRVPHPRDFGVDGPLGSNFPNTTDYPWTTGITMSRTRNGSSISASEVFWIPASAAAAELDQCLYDEGPGTADSTFAYDELQEAVMRLNNFNLGDGYQFVRADGNVLDTTLVNDISYSATQDIYNSRISSPKLLMTFGAPDIATMSANGIDAGERTALINAGLAPLMKVTTVIESAQNESALRTYTIPKAANTGGSFMVITDHMGEKEKNDTGLTALPKGSSNANRIILEKVVAHEVVRTGQVNDSYDYGFIEGESDSGFYLSYYPGYELLPINYIKDYGIANSLKTERVMTDPQMMEDGTPTRFGSNVRRDLDSYWATDTAVYVGPFRDNDTGVAESFNKSEIRYRRLNEDYVMFDFNLDLRALAFNTLENCNPTTGIWNDHGVTRRILGDSTSSAAVGNADLAAYVHSPYAPGHLLDSIDYFDDGFTSTANKNVWVGIDARWVQYIRFSYDVQRDAIGSVDDPYFYERQFGGGPSFGNWNEYRAWYPGTATVGPYVTSTIYTEYQFGQNRSDESSLGGGASGYNATDGYLGSGGWPNSTAYQWNTGGTGSAYVTPKDGSPYSVWNSIVDINDSSVYNIVRYWNGRMNDWYMSRWSQHENASGSFPGNNYDSQVSTSLTAASNRFTPEYNKEFGHPGYVGSAATWRSWQNNESTAAGYIMYPDPYDTYSSPARVNQPWINQYAYKLLWKSIIPFDYGVGVLGQPQFNLYTEHSKLFDDIIQRSFGDKAWNRNGTMQWRVTPSGKGTGDIANDGPAPVGATNWSRTAENVTFVVEIMFDEPIFVSGRQIQRYASDTDLQAGSADGVFSSGSSPFEAMWQHVQNQLSFAGIQFDTLSNTARVSPVSNLTLRGQSVVKYKRTDYSQTTAVTD